MKHIDHPEHVLKLWSKNKTLNKIWRAIEEIVSQNIELGNLFWEPYIFAPHSAWNHVLSINNQMKFKDDELNIFTQDMQFIGTFRYTKDIYKFDKTLLTHLLNTPVTNVNAMALTRLPEYCIYVALDGAISFKGKPLLGFYAVYDDDFAAHRLWGFDHFSDEEAELLGKYPLKLRLRFLYQDSEKNNIYTSCIPLRDGDIHDVWKETVNLKNEVASHGKITFGQNTMLEDDDIDLLKRVLPILFYLCTDEPEIRDRKCSKIVKIPRYKKETQKKLFSPPVIRYWDVGKDIGKKLLMHTRSGVAKGLMTPHLRRAHWHGFWKGTKDEKVMHYKWLPPIFVNADIANQPIAQTR